MHVHYVANLTQQTMYRYDSLSVYAINKGTSKCCC